jgi:hypothetical protein
MAAIAGLSIYFEAKWSGGVGPAPPAATGGAPL